MSYSTEYRQSLADAIIDRVRTILTGPTDMTELHRDLRDLLHDYDLTSN